MGRIMREEAIEALRYRRNIINNVDIDWCANEIAAIDVALSTLRPISREQVILCKDCQYWQGNNGGYPHPECRWGNDETPDEDDYCSFAERLEGME